ncbi:MAG: energy transducer TonB [Chitinophagaceae bacterium]|nr:energy transducer TonB [Chitinophagaceae bacterium]
MDSNKILSANILDIIFEGKNKIYGAYELRKSYNSRLIKALFFTAVIAMILFLSTVFAKNPDKAGYTIIVEDHTIPPVVDNLPPPVVTPPPKVNLPPATTKSKQVKFTIPVIVKKENVTDDEIIETVTDNTAIGNETIRTNNTAIVVDIPVSNEGSTVIAAPQADADNTIFNKVEVEASFSEGNAGWVRFLQKNLNAGILIDNGAPEGSYTVIVQFIVYKDGSVKEVTATTHHGYGMEAEAVRAIKKSGNWKPAQQNGNQVNAYRSQPITFVVEAN